MEPANGDSEPSESTTDGSAVARSENTGIARAFADGPAFVPYVVAGDPDAEATKAYVRALVRGGADVVELGLPFSEPIAEGSTIQDAIVRSLEGGMTPERFFELVEALDVDVPLVVMTYYNLIFRYGREPPGDADVGAASGPCPERAQEGVEPFVRRAAEAGIAGLVVPDLPVEESGPLRSACEEYGLDLVFVVAPTTRGERLNRILEQVSGFVYVQARLGTTGARTDVSDQTEESLARLDGHDVPTAVGFGISEPEHAREVVAAGADGVVVGSALVDVIAEGTSAGPRPRSEDDVASDVEEGEVDVPARLEAKARELAEGAREGFAQRVPGPEGS